MLKRRSFPIVSALVTSASIVFSSSAASAQSAGVEIANQTERSIIGLYISPSERSSFEFNQLSGQGILPGQSVLFEPRPDICFYDFLTVFSDGESVADYDIDICNFSGGKYTLFEPDSEAGRLVVYNGTDSELREILIEGASSTQPRPPALAETETPALTSPESPQALPAAPAAICENYSNPRLRAQCIELFLAAGVDGDQIVVDSRSSRTEASSDCTNGNCDSRFSRTVGLLGSYAIGSGADAWILTNRSDLSCDTIWNYDITATFANGQQETKRAVNLCGQDNIFFGQPKQGTPVTVTVVNATDQSQGKTDLVLREIYLAPANSNTWGYNLLEAQLIAPGETSQISFVDTTTNCTYDIRAVFVNPDQVEHLDPVRWSGVNLCDLDDGALVYGLTASAQPPQAQHQAIQRLLKQLVRPKSEVCLASSGSSVCQPARRRNTSSQRAWWQIWRLP